MEALDIPESSHTCWCSLTREPRCPYSPTFSPLQHIVPCSCWIAESRKPWRLYWRHQMQKNALVPLSNSRRRSSAEQRRVGAHGGAERADVAGAWRSDQPRRRLLRSADASAACTFRQLSCVQCCWDVLTSSEIAAVTRNFAISNCYQFRTIFFPNIVLLSMNFLLFLETSVGSSLLYRLYLLYLKKNEN